MLVTVKRTRSNMNKNSQIKEVIAEAVISFLNEARRFPEPDNTPNKPKKPSGIHPAFDPDNKVDQEYLDKQYGVEGGGTHLSPWINKGPEKQGKKPFKPYIHPSIGKFEPNPPGLNERQMAEIESIYEELEKGLRED